MNTKWTLSGGLTPLYIETIVKRITMNITIADEIRKQMADWNKTVSVEVTENNKQYVVKGDKRIPKGMQMDRVTSILGIIDKYPLRIWAMNQALDYVKDHINSEMPVEELINNARQAHEQRRDDSANFGTEAHYLLEQYTNDTSIAIPRKFQPVIDSWEEWVSSSGIQIVSTEQSLYYYNPEKKIGFAGTADVIAVDPKGNPVIVDYKTGAGIYPEHALQMSAYSLALWYCSIGNFMDVKTLSGVRAFVLRLPKEEGLETEMKEVNNLVGQQESFIHALELKRSQSYRGKWKRSNRRGK